MIVVFPSSGKVGDGQINIIREIKDIIPPPAMNNKPPVNVHTDENYQLTEERQLLKHNIVICSLNYVPYNVFQNMIRASSS